MTPIMVDTDVLIWVLRGRPEAIHWHNQPPGAADWSVPRSPCPKCFAYS